MPSRTSSPRKSPGALLDPYGIYGTRTANRLRAARRRRQSQNAILILVLIGAFAAGAQLLKMRRVMALRPDTRLELSVPMVTPPLPVLNANATNAAFLLAATDGRLLRLEPGFDEAAEPQTVLDTAFPLHLPLQRGDRVFVPCEDGTLYAVDWRQSRVLWTYTFRAPLATRPAYATLMVNAPSGAASKVRREAVIAAAGDGVLAALDAGSGKPRWKVKLPCPLGDALCVTTDPAPRVLVPLLGSSFSRGGLWCLDAVTGRVLWRFPAGAQSEAAQFAAPAFDAVDDKLFFGNETGALFCLDAQSGTYNVKKRIGWKTFVPPLDRKSETAIAWRAAPLLFFGDERSGASTRLIVGGSDGGVRALNARDGALLWRFKAGAPIANLQKLSAGGRDLVLVCSRADSLFLLDAANGAVVKHMASRGQLMGASATGEDVLAVTMDGTVEHFPLRF
jgi:outer membrane protein assembly factor BamB